MYEVCAELEFSAAHFHPLHTGKCRNVHGHNYKVKVRVRSEDLDELGMVCDFYLLKNETKVLLEEFDHTMINDHKDFQEMPPAQKILPSIFLIVCCHNWTRITTSCMQWKFGKAAGLPQNIPEHQNKFAIVWQRNVGYWTSLIAEERGYFISEYSPVITTLFKFYFSGNSSPVSFA